VVTRNAVEILTLLAEDVARVRTMLPVGVTLPAGAESHESVATPVRS
jgi:hypothetical protein